MKVVCLTRYDSQGASSRVRFLQYFDALSRQAPGLALSHQALLDAGYLHRKYAGRSSVGTAVQRYFKRAAAAPWRALADVWWIEKELWPYLPAALELALLRGCTYVLDLDDAIFHTYDLHPNPLVRRCLGSKTDRLMAGAALVTAGNDYLAARARAAGAPWVEVLPTVVDLARYPFPPQRATAPAVEDKVTIGWIGSPATVHYLAQLADPLARLAHERPLRVEVVGGGAINLPGVDLVPVAWSESTEAASIARFDIGVMPLTDSPWERGKCGYKLIQYMACGVPVVASPVGANRTIVCDGLNGLLAADADGWYEALARLAADAALRARMGAAGRQRVESDYSVQAMAPRLAQWLRVVGAGAGR